jgi:hypothetical protein
VGTAISNDVNQNDKAVGIRFRQRDKVSADVVWSVFERLAQSNATFNALDTLIIVVHSVGIPVKFGGAGCVKSKGRPLSIILTSKQVLSKSKLKGNVWPMLL